MNNRTMQQVIEERGKLIKQLRDAIDDKSFDEPKVEKINEDIERLNAEKKLIEIEQGKVVNSLGGEKAPEMRIYGEKETLKSAPAGDLEQWVSDVIKAELGVGGLHNRDVAEGSGSGQYLVPSPLHNQLVSYITEKSILGRLGVTNVAVKVDTTTYAQVSALPTANVIAEASSVTETDATYTPRTLQMYSYRAGTIASFELVEDAIASPGMILEPIVQSISQNIDYDFINGAAPLGLHDMTGTYLRYRLSENGAALTGFEEMGTLWMKAREKNIDVSAFIMSPRTMRDIRLLEDAYEAPKANPFSDIPMIETVHVGNAETVGSGTTCSRIYAGDYKKAVWAGWRYGSSNSIKLLVDRTTLAEAGAIRFYGVCRMGLAYPYGNSKFGWLAGILQASGAIT